MLRKFTFFILINLVMFIKSDDSTNEGELYRNFLAQQSDFFDALDESDSGNAADESNLYRRDSNPNGISPYGMDEDESEHAKYHRFISNEAFHRMPSYRDVSGQSEIINNGELIRESLSHELKSEMNKTFLCFFFFISRQFFLFLFHRILCVCVCFCHITYLFLFLMKG